MRRCLIFAAFAVILSGCGGGIKMLPTVEPSVVSTVPQGGKTVTDNPDTMSWSEFTQAAKQGQIVKVRLCRAGTTVTEYEAVVMGFDNSNSERLVIVRMKPVYDAGGRDVTPMVGEGDSGSPVLFNGKTVAVLCYGLVSGDNITFGARAVEDVMNVTGTIGRGVRQIDARYKLIGLSRINTLKMGASISISRSRQVGELIPGMTITIYEVSGPVIFAVTGTISVVKGRVFWAFGHMFNMNGVNSSPVVLSEMSTLGGGIGSSSAVKIYTPTTQVIGTMTQDGFCGIKIDRDVVAKTYPVTVKMTIDGQTKTDQVAQFTAHNWQMLGGGGFFGYSEGGLIPSYVNWVVQRAVGKVVGGQGHGTIAIKYPGNPEVKVTFDTTDGKNANIVESTDISGDVYGRVSNFLGLNQMPWMSPEYMVVDANITTGPKAQVLASIVDKDDMLISNDSKTKVMLTQSTDPADKGYTVTGYVPGWTGYTVTVSLSDQSAPDVLTLTGNNIKATGVGTAMVHVTVTNTATGTKLELTPPFTVEVTEALPKG